MRRGKGVQPGKRVEPPISGEILVIKASPVDCPTSEKISELWIP